MYSKHTSRPSPLQALSINRGPERAQRTRSVQKLPRALFTIVGGAVLLNPAFAQEQTLEELEEIVVTGLRGSLKASALPPCASLARCGPPG